MRDHNKLRAFKLADELAIEIYQVTTNFPKEEIYGLTYQVRRAAVSVASNIVEGYARESQSECLRFLEIAFGYVRELHHQINLSSRLGYLREKVITMREQKLVEAEKVLGALFRSMRRSTNNQLSYQPLAYSLNNLNSYI